MLVLAASAAAADDRAARDADALARAGTAAMEAGRLGDALDAFTRAAALRPGDASLCFGAGVAAFMLGQNDLAQARFECALSRKPEYLPAALWLGDLHYRAGRLRQAIAVYEAARQRTPDARELQARLAMWRKEHELESRFRAVRSEHFTALFELSADEPLAREALRRLEAAYGRVGSALHVYPVHAITVVLYTRDQFADITRLASWSAAGYDGRIRVPLDGSFDDGDELDRVLSHEYVHAIVAMLGGRTVPAWVNEGLATALEPAGTLEAEAITAHRAAGPPLTALHRSFVDLSRRDAEVAYASAARAVRALLDRRGAAALVALLQDLSRGAPFSIAFERRVGIRYENFVRIMSRP